MRANALAVLALLVVGCDRQTPSGPSTTGISGRVMEFSSGMGVAGAMVAFGDASAVTNATGLYTIERLASGGYEPRVDGVWMGQSRVTGSGYRGDLLVQARASRGMARWPMPRRTVPSLGPPLRSPDPGSPRRPTAEPMVGIGSIWAAPPPG
jgi:hypothetical protein